MTNVIHSMEIIYQKTVGSVPCGRPSRGGLAAVRRGKVMEERYRCLAKATVAVCALIALGACATTASTFPLNDAAQRLGPIRVAFVRSSAGRGPVTITMADGEVLRGGYRVAFGTANDLGFVGRSSASDLVIIDGPVLFVAKGPKTQILCRGNSSTVGLGSGQCQTYEGAVWGMSWCRGMFPFACDGPGNRWP